jgi:histidinol dehydrogenase
MLQVFENPAENIWPSILKRPSEDNVAVQATVTQILQNVKTNGDAALKEYALKFDNVVLDSLLVTPTEITAAADELSAELKEAIATAHKNIYKFHAAQTETFAPVETMPGVTCWRKSTAIQKVGLYIPGGSAPLFSTLLMLGTPAKIAGCANIVLCTPCNQQGKINAAILYTASLLGINTIYKIGGAQAIAAMAYGTQSVLKVHKIFGPGNQYVTVAKSFVNQQGVAIDMPAGPSEVLVYANQTSNAAFVAADLLSQAEHGPDSQVVLVCNNKSVVENVNTALQAQLPTLSRAAIAVQALANSKAIVIENKQVAFNLINQYAAEHLIIATDDAAELAEQVYNAGSIFLGHYTPESVGDYASGTNHTLPTNGYATAYAGVSLDSFVKKITLQQLTKEGLQNIGKTVEVMATAEGLLAHKESVSIRLQQINKP